MKYSLFFILAFTLFCQPMSSIVGASIQDPSSELLKIEKLLTRLQHEKSVIFWRNGRTYEINKAVSHLQRKLDKNRADITTVEQFIEDFASKSSWTGIPYKIILLDGKEISCKEFLLQLYEEGKSS